MTGLTDTQVAEARREHGWNILTPPKKQSLWKLYIEKYNDPIIRILLLAAAISLALAVAEGQYVETVGIFIAICTVGIMLVGYFFNAISPLLL